jgi:hypothetical protein
MAAGFAGSGRQPAGLRTDASGSDVFRIFVVALPTSVTRFVRGLEFALALPAWCITRTSASIARRIAAPDESDPLPGYDGLSHSAVYPDGHFLAWTPGQGAAPTKRAGVAARSRHRPGG